jgi:hypothetical protein
MRTYAVFAIKILLVLILAGLTFVLLRPAVVVLTDISTFLVSVFFIPIAVIVLGWFVFSVWGRVYFRAWHIRRIRNARYLREAIERGRGEA